MIGSTTNTQHYLNKRTIEELEKLLYSTIYKQDQLIVEMSKQIEDQSRLDSLKVQYGLYESINEDLTEMLHSIGE